eukprot:COSAG04_NODE_897_length_9581_cov_96.260599_6_plen_95_part_00
MCGGGHEMTVGVHCAHFELRKLDVRAMVGVVGPGFDPAAGGAAFRSAEGWLMATDFGELYHRGSESTWEGQPKYEIKEGDVVVRRPPCAAPWVC